MADPLKYFRIEARELLDSLGRAMLDLERGEANPDLIARILRSAHTLKGAARVVKVGTVAERAHSLEDALAPYRDQTGPLPREVVRRVFELIDGIGTEVSALDPRPAAIPDGALRSFPEEPFETVRVELDEMDALLEGVAEATVQFAALRHQIEGFERVRTLSSRLRERVLAEELNGAIGQLEARLESGLERAEAELVQVRDAAYRLRLLPARLVFASLERATHDAARSLDRRVEFVASGAEVRIDANVLGAARVAMLHAVRNAVAHGIEPEAERAAAAKPLVGRVSVQVERRGTRVAFVCRDDGRGIDVERLRQAAVRSGKASTAQAAAMGMDDVVALILRGGVSTTAAATEVSGRGIGLDVVRETALRLKGMVNVRSERSRGTTVELSVPISLASLLALEVEVAGVVASIPLDSVCETLSIPPEAIARTSRHEAVTYQGAAIPLVSLARVLRRAAAPRGRRSCTAVVLRADGALAAFQVDRLLGVATVVVRTLPLYSPTDPVIAGASQDAHGHPQLVLDPAGLVAAARAGVEAMPEPAASARPPILVIDDSLTTRMLEQSILESVGYEVDMATSGEEAMEKARSRRYGLFVVDVEMPGMDGFEFVERTRADVALREVPAILVTSRDTSDDRRRGAEVGAHSYIVKGEFDQGQLLTTIRELIG